MFYVTVAALMSIKGKMIDEYHVLNGWDINSVDPCTWNMVACSSEGFVISLLVSNLLLFLYMFESLFQYVLSIHCKKTVVKKQKVIIIT